jgi:hypothetical protein
MGIIDDAQLCLGRIPRQFVKSPLSIYEQVKSALSVRGGTFPGYHTSIRNLACSGAVSASATLSGGFKYPLMRLRPR